MADGTRLTREDRVLLIINDQRVRGAIRLQKYGFLLAMKYKLEMAEIRISHGVEFYRDWKPHHYGPYSRSLEDDVRKCGEEGMMDIVNSTLDKPRIVQSYRLTVMGRRRWRDLYSAIGEMKKFDAKVRDLQRIPYYTLLSRVYNAYPEYTGASRTGDSTDP